MCLLIVLSRVLPDWPLIVAANRDERYDRPAEPLVLLRSVPARTLGGRDLLAGGTWLAVNEHAVMAGLTNQPIPEGRDPTKRSRGEIPLALTEHVTAASAVTAFPTSAPGGFNPCWVLVGDRRALFYLDMTAEGMHGVELTPGIHVLENKSLHQASAKVDYVRSALEDAPGRSPDDVFGMLRGLLGDHTITHPAESDGEDARRRAQASACCVHSEAYGTRSSMLVGVQTSADALPEVWVSDGPSCVNPLTKATLDLWGPPAAGRASGR